MAWVDWERGFRSLVLFLVTGVVGWAGYNLQQSVMAVRDLSNGMESLSEGVSDLKEELAESNKLSTGRFIDHERRITTIEVKLQLARPQ